MSPPPTQFSTTGKQTSGLEVLSLLHEKFAANFLQATEKGLTHFADAEIKIRAIAEFGQLLRKRTNITPLQSALSTAADEIFADVTCSVYLAAASLGPPAPMLLRRALELGIAVVYLWDLPHLFWAWKDFDQDLSFKEMLIHLESAAFLALLRNEGLTISGGVIDSQATKTLYRTLSNTIHGKPTTFEVLSETRYAFDSEAWDRHAILTMQVVDIILGIWGTRFPETLAALSATLPELSRVR